MKPMIEKSAKQRRNKRQEERWRLLRQWLAYHDAHFAVAKLKVREVRRRAKEQLGIGVLPRGWSKDLLFYRQKSGRRRDPRTSMLSSAQWGALTDWIGAHRLRVERMAYLDQVVMAMRHSGLPANRSIVSEALAVMKITKPCTPPEWVAAEVRNWAAVRDAEEFKP